jgi:DNA-binding MarR family transcriptional regulator
MQASDAERRRLAEQLLATRRAMVRDMLLGALAELAEGEITLAQLAALMLLEDGRPRPVNDIAARLGRSLSAASRLLDQLARRRLLKRQADPADRRVRLLVIAERGRALLAALLERRAAAQLALMERLSPAERERVLEGMALLAEAAGRPEPAPPGEAGAPCEADPGERRAAPKRAGGREPSR